MVGVILGKAVGAAVGEAVVGVNVGFLVGSEVGDLEGFLDGALVGDFVVGTAPLANVAKLIIRTKAVHFAIFATSQMYSNRVTVSEPCQCTRHKPTT